MHGDFTKSERKKIRQLASLAWERELRVELRDIAAAIEEMENGHLSPFDVSDRIHKFHDGAARDLYKQCSDSLPWFGVCRAHFDRVLTDDDIADASLLLVDYTGRLCRAGKARVSREVASVLDRLGTSAEVWGHRIQELFSRSRLLGSYFTTERRRLRDIAAQRGKHHLDNLASCPAG